MAGRYKYICYDCGGATYLGRRERQSRHRSHCKHCGSLSLDPSPASVGPQRLLEKREAWQQDYEERHRKMEGKY